MMETAGTLKILGTLRTSGTKRTLGTVGTPEKIIIILGTLER